MTIGLVCCFTYTQAELLLWTDLHRYLNVTPASLQAVVL